MANFDPNSVTGLIGLWDFKSGAKTADTGLADGIAQNGTFESGAGAFGDRAHFNGTDDRLDVEGDNGGPKESVFDLSSGTIEVQFKQDQQLGKSHDTLVNRGEYHDRGHEGWFAIQVTAHGAVEVTHITKDGTTSVLKTANHVFKPGDTVNVKYSWDATTGATLTVENLTKNTTTEVSTTKTGLDLDIGDNDDEIFTFGARESNDGSYDQEYDGSIDYVAVYESANAGPDGAVDGEAFGEVMVVGYDDSNAPTDNGGDVITNDADLIFGNGGNDDISGGGGGDTIYGDIGGAFGAGVPGDDEIDGDAGDDLIFGQEGDDTIDGGTGKDTIFGDGADTGAGGSFTGPRESFNWDLVSSSQADSTVTQDTGDVNVTYTRTQDTGHHDSDVDNSTPLNITGIDGGGETVDNNSSLASETGGNGNTGAFKWEFSEPVGNVDFNINDLDGDGVITVRAFDADGNEIPVTLTGGTDVDINGNTAEGNLPYQPTNDPDNNVQVEIAGPVSRIEVVHTQVGSDNSGIWITDMYYDTGFVADPDAGANGDDVLNGGAQDDIIWGDDGPGPVTGSGTPTTLDIDDLSGGQIVAGDGSVTATLDDFSTKPVGFLGADSGILYAERISSPNEASVDLSFDTPVEDVSFTLFDLDDGYNPSYGDWDDQITIIAVDANGNEVPVTFTGNGNANGNTFESDTELGDGELDANNPNNVQVNIDGPITSLKIIYEQGPDGNATGYIGVSDLTVTAVPEATFDQLLNAQDGEGGNDVLEGEEGADQMWGQGGDDTIVVSSAADADGDIVVGGNGPDQNTDTDILDLRGAGKVTIVETADATDAGATTGTVTFEDGSTLEFYQIEEILTDPQNEAPEITNAADVTIDENTTPVLDVDATDPDGDDVDFSITGGADAALFTIDPDTGALSFISAPDFENPADDNGDNIYEVEVTATDPGGLTDSETINVTVADVNEAPDVTGPSDVGVDENVTGVIADFDATDPDAGDTVTFSLAGDDAALFTIDPDTGELSFITPPDFENPADDDGDNVYEVTVIGTDDGGLTDQQDVSITVGDVDENEAPTITSSDAVTVDENTTFAVDVDVDATDPNGDTVEFSITGGDDAALFTIDPDTGELSFISAPDFENPADANGDNVYEVEVTATDPGGLTDVQPITVTVGDVNEAPDVTGPADVPVDENVTGVIADFDATDPDAGDTVTFSLAGDDAALFTIDPDTGELSFVTPPDFENPADDDGDNVYEVTVIGTDDGGLTDQQDVSITVGDVNEAPVANDDTGLTTDSVTPLTIDVVDNDVDPDGDMLTISDPVLNDPKFGTVEVVNNEIVFTPADDAIGQTVEITYTATDPDGLSDTATAFVSVTDAFPPDGIVDGEETGELMVPDYDDSNLPTDQGGDIIDGPDGLDDVIEANGGDDIIDSGAGDDTVDGGDGDDTFVLTDDAGNIDNDSLVGGEGDEDGPGDSIDASDFEDDLTVNFTAPETGTITDGTDTTVFEEIERVETGAGDDTVTGSDGDDFVSTNGGDDSVIGGEGDDTLLSGDGLDTVDGGAGNDSLVGGDEADSITGGADDDTIEGGRGPDTLDGGTGNDSILGGNDDDSIIGGEGADTVDGGNGDNVIDTSGQDPLTNNLLDDKNGDGFGFGSPLVPADTDEDNDRDLVTAGSGDDTITTGDDADTIFGGSGDNVIDSGIDNDEVTTTFGNDFIVTGEGADKVSSGAGNDTIYGGLDPSFPDELNVPDDGSGPFGADPDTENGRDSIEAGAGQDLVFGQDDDDTIRGGGGADTLDGGIDDDSIFGDAGQDDLIGGQGADTMFGGADRDEFLIDNREDAFGDEIDGGTDGNDVDTLDLRGLGKFEIVNETVDADGDSTSGTVNFLAADGVTVEGTLEFAEIERLIPCFTPGTRIATLQGEVRVEDLKAGDRVITRDDGIQEIQWIGKKKVSGHDMLADPKLKPVLIKAGSLGGGLPMQDMLVSPNHRMLIANENTQMLFDEREVLVAAKHLVGQPGVQMIDTIGTEYIHVMFERHQVILGDGAWTESFQPGDQTIGGFDAEQREEIFKLFPSLKAEKGRQAYGSARQSLKAFEARALREVTGGTK
jgi:hypothetical protein